MKVIPVLISCIYICSSANAQKLQPGKVPRAALEAFRKAHTGTEGKWEKEGKNYEVNFKENNQTMSSVIDARGNILETETVLPTDGLPKEAQDYMTRHYAHVKVKEVARIVKANGTVNYEAGVKGKDVLFDENGKFLGVAKD
jgi:hypothetical protein